MFRIGQGWDRHPLQDGQRCVLGGVEFTDAAAGPVGHSDADVVCHAITDALLGAACLGDIGQHFPDTAAAYAGADSLALLVRAWNLVTEKGFQLGNIDVTIITEAPAIAPRSLEMRQKLATALAVQVDQISLKATRGEGLGPEGRRECITVQAIALLEAK